MLQVTHIGKEVNSLRKWDGEVGDKAKALVKKWKQLLPPDSESSKSTTSPAVNGEEVTGHLHSHKRKKGERVKDGDSRVAHISHKSSGRLATDSSATSSECDDFSRALMVDYSSASSSSKRTKSEPADGAGPHDSAAVHRHKHKHKHSHREPQLRPPSLPNHSTPSFSHQPPSAVATTSVATLTRPKSPPSSSWLDVPALPGGPSYSPTNSRKRKGIVLRVLC